MFRHSLSITDFGFRRPKRADCAEQRRTHYFTRLVANGNQLAYVSFEHKKPVVYVQYLTSGQRRVVSNQKGNNSAPAWSPDGKRLALALSLSGNTQIYLVNADGSGLRRLS